MLGWAPNGLQRTVAASNSLHRTVSAWDSTGESKRAGSSTQTVQNKDYPIGYIPTIDGIRGVLPFGVLAAHIQYSWFPGAIVFMNIFFILSAYLITALLIKDIKKYGKIRFKIFYIRRILRLFPAYYVMLFFFFLAVTILLQNPQLYYKDILFSGCYISNWIRAFSIETPDWLGHTWSLSIEEQYYICWPLLLYLLTSVFGKGQRLILILILLYASFTLWRYYLAYTGSPIVRLYNGTDVRADTLLVGCIIAILHENFHHGLRFIIKISHILFFPLCVLIFIILGFSLSWQNRYVYTWGTTLIDISVGLFLIGLITKSGTIIHRIFESKVLIFLGKISYATYLWHYPIFKFIRHYHGNDLSVIIYGVPVTYFCAWLSSMLIEKPCIKLKRKFV